MKKTLDYRALWNKFSEIEAFLGKEPDEDRCQEALLNLEKISKSVREQADVILASEFNSLWSELNKKIKEYSDCKTFLDSKREIEGNLNAILEPDLA